MRYPQNCQKTFPGTRQIGRILTKVWISAPKKLGNSWSFSKSLLTRMYPVHSILPSNLNRKKITHSKRHTFNHFITVHSLYPAPELYSAAPRFFLSRDTHICAAQKAAEFRPRVRMLNLDWSVTRCRNSGAQIPVATGVATWPGLCQHYSTMSGKKMMTFLCYINQFFHFWSTMKPFAYQPQVFTDNCPWLRSIYVEIHSNISCVWMMWVRAWYKIHTTTLQLAFYWNTDPQPKGADPGQTLWFHTSI